MLTKILCASLIFGSMAVYAQTEDTLEPVEERQQESFESESFETTPDSQRMEDVEIERMEDHSDHSMDKQEEPILDDSAESMD